MKTTFFISVMLFIFCNNVKSQNFIEEGPPNVSLTDINGFFSSLHPGSQSLADLRDTLECSNTDLLRLISRIQSNTYNINSTSRNKFLLIDRDDYRNISIYPIQSQKLNNSSTLSRWILFQLIIITQPYNILEPNNTVSVKTRRNFDKKIAAKFAHAYDSYLRALRPAQTMSQIDYTIDCDSRMIPSKHFNRLVVKDASYLMGGENGKLNQSKLALNLFNPTIQSFFQTLKNNQSNSLQIGLTAKLDQPITIANWEKANFRGLFSIQWDRVISNANYHFYADTCINEIIEGYLNQNITQENIFDSLYSKLNWNTKKIQWISFKTDGIFKSYNLFDIKNDNKLMRGIQGGFAGEFSWNYHHYVNPKYNGSDKTYGNKYLKLGTTFSLSNKIENENLKAIEFETYEHAADSSQKISNRLNAFDESDFKNQFFSLSPFVDFYVMNKKRNFGIHLYTKYHIPFTNNYKSDQSLVTAFGIFTSINRNFITDLFHQTENSIVNIELLFTSGNLLNKDIRSQDFFGGIFRPEIKFEIPFTMLTN